MLKYNEFIVEKVVKKVYKNELIEAAKRGSANKVKDLLKKGEYDINEQDKEGKTALMYAALNKFISVVDILINAKADTNIRDYLGRTALMMSSTMKVIDKLLEGGADVNIQSNKGVTAIIDYLQFNQANYFTILEKFLKLGLNLDLKDNNGDNLYDHVKRNIKVLEGLSRVNFFLEVEKYLDEHFPQYKEEWEFKQNIDKYGL